MDFWKSFKHKIQRARQLSPRDWLVLAEAWWILLGFNLALRWVPFDRLEAFTRPASEKAILMPTNMAWAWHRQRLIGIAARYHMPSMTCLPRALTLRWMASRHAIPTQLRIGANKTSSGILAHAWVEFAGEAIGEPEDIFERFYLLAAVEPKQPDSN